MSTISEIQQAKSRLESAETDLADAVKRGVREGLIQAFEDASVSNVVFGVCTAPFNDENPGQGTFGPLVNVLDENETIDSDYDGAGYELFYNYGSTGTGSQAALLASVLREAGWEASANALGVDYWPDEGSGQNVAFVARRTDSGFNLEENSVGY